MRLSLLTRSAIAFAVVLAALAVLVLARPAGQGGPAVRALPTRAPDPDAHASRAAFTPRRAAGLTRWLAGLPRRPATWHVAGTRSAAIAFTAPTYPTNSANTEAAEPSIKVDRTDANHRIWVTAPTGIGIRTGLLPVGGDLVWYSDNAGQTWQQAGGPTWTTTIVGGGDTDVAPANGSAVYVTGLTLANVTLAASCNNGTTFTTNPISTAGTIEDRQWLDAYVDHAKPLTAPDFLLDIGLAQLDPSQPENPRVAFYQVTSPAPACPPPLASAPIDTALPGCPLTPPVTPDCYQWPGNLAIDEQSGDAYVTYNTLGTDSLNGVPSINDDKVVVARITGGASGPATQLNASIVEAAKNRPDTFDSFTVVAVDKAGNVYVLWNERHPNLATPSLGETATMYAYSTNHGATWSAPIQINQGPKTTTFPWLVAGDAGKIDVVYYGTDATGPSPETVPDSSQWKVYMAQTLNATSATPTFTESVASPIVHQGFICTSGTGCAPGTRDLLDYFQVDMDAQCMANIAYTDNFVHGTTHTYVAFVRQTDGPAICSGNPTAVAAKSFAARRSAGEVLLRWRTASEAGLLGFDLYRGSRRLNRALIRAHGGSAGSAYSFVDRAAPTRALTYRLQIVRRDGSRSWAQTVRLPAR